MRQERLRVFSRRMGDGHARPANDLCVLARLDIRFEVAVAPGTERDDAVV